MAHFWQYTRHAAILHVQWVHQLKNLTLPLPYYANNYYHNENQWHQICRRTFINMKADFRYAEELLLTWRQTMGSFQRQNPHAWRPLFACLWSLCTRSPSRSACSWSVCTRSLPLSVRSPSLPACLWSLCTRSLSLSVPFTCRTWPAPPFLIGHFKRLLSLGPSQSEAELSWLALRLAAQFDRELLGFTWRHIAALWEREIQREGSWGSAVWKNAYVLCSLRLLHLF